jgi:hypothetical protein
VRARSAVSSRHFVPAAAARRPGTAWLAWHDWRRTALLLAIPAYYLLSESPFIYEWRVVAPMHYGLFAAAGAAPVAAVAYARRRWR